MHHTHDPLRGLQDAARAAADAYTGQPARRVVVFDEDGKALLAVRVPHVCGCHGVAESREEPAAGWSVTDRGATFDGKPVAVSRPKLLRVLVEAEQPLTLAELTGLAFGPGSHDVATTYHLRELKRQLKKGLPGFEGDPIPGDDAGGYQLAVR